MRHLHLHLHKTGDAGTTGKTVRGVTTWGNQEPAKALQNKDESSIILDAFEEGKHPRSHGQFAKTAGKRELPPPGNVQTTTTSLPQASAQEREELAPYIERGLKRTPGKFSVKEVLISKLIATQQYIEPHVLASKIKKHDPALPEVFEMNGKYYISDGHHRIEAAKKKEKSVIKVAIEHIK